MFSYLTRAFRNVFLKNRNMFFLDRLAFPQQEITGEEHVSSSIVVFGLQNDGGKSVGIKFPIAGGIQYLKLTMEEAEMLVTAVKKNLEG